MINNNQITELIAKANAGTLTEEEALLLDSYYAAFDELPGFTGQLTQEQQLSLQAVIYNDIQARILPAQAPVKRLLFTRFTAAAVMVGVLITSGLFWFWWHNQSQQTLTAQINTGVQQLKKQVLPDGTQVWLNENSTLAYKENSSHTERRVTLSGEAFFEVVHNASKPFIVEANDVTVKVLGTSFNIRARTAQATDVMVQAGMVEVSTPKGRKQLKAHELLSYTPENGFAGTADSVVKPASYTAWRKPQLDFKGERLEQVINNLELYYNITITYPEQLKDCTLYASFEGADVSDAIHSICTILNASSSLQDNKAVITGGSCN